MLEVNIVDVLDESKLLNYVTDGSDAVESESKVLPFELNQVLDQIALEHFELIRVCQGLHELAIFLGHGR